MKTKMNKLEHGFVVVPLNPNAVIKTTMCNTCGKNTVAIAHNGQLL